ncbi:MAG TPA: DUF5667 domain-containing protein [Candidatus Paceibacterota bacterium]|nr:DUF5667 domain-containing protein [Candidatus Paceibacterota bacterium]
MTDRHFLKKFRSGTARPDEAFVRRGKERFLAAFDARFGTRPERAAAHGLPGWMRAATAVLAGAIFMVSVAAYADAANVSADSPLYPLKRWSEGVRLALTPTNGQAQFEATLAARRANEIADLSTRKPTSSLISGLAVDFDDAVSSSLAAVAPVSRGDHEGSGPSGASGAAGVNGAATMSAPVLPGTVGSSTNASSSNEGGRPHGNHGRQNAAVTATSTMPSYEGQAAPTGTAVATPSFHVPNGEPSSTVCRTMFALFKDSSEARAELIRNPELLDRFESRCGGSGSAAEASGTVSASASTTIMIMPAHGGSVEGASTSSERGGGGGGGTRKNGVVRGLRL